MPEHGRGADAHGWENDPVQPEIVLIHQARVTTRRKSMLLTFALRRSTHDGVLIFKIIALMPNPVVIVGST